ncbi:MAG TPA: nickel pincer cofactor biosynthesis protein LarB [Nitrospiria bacterium]|nr:nickel pincer cofactor biosynthesis protein LarB [Nitrospiria bacterium]
MFEPRLRSLLTAVRCGRLSLEQAVDALRHLPYEDLGYARLDHHRPLRQGLPEVIFCEGKAPEHVSAILGRMQERESPVLATRVAPQLAAYLKRRHPGLVYHRLARLAVLPPRLLTHRQAARPRRDAPLILVITAGTADLPVAEEARLSAETFGHRVDTLYDAGVAGLHRLTGHLRLLQRADVLIVIAGMEGALPSIVGGLTGRPVIAVPTSRGYGAHFGGLAPLLTMLTSCAPGLAVVNIDNGFGAAALAHRILMSPVRRRTVGTVRVRRPEPRLSSRRKPPRA